MTARIVSAILGGGFSAGHRLVVQHVAKVYEVSPTPVREAMVELASFGLVDLLPNRGAIVRPFGLRQVHEISEIRRVLETEAARCACGHIPTPTLAALNEELTRLDGLSRDESWDCAAREVDTRLHGLIAESSGNTRLAAEIGRYLVLFRALRDMCHLRDARNHYSRANDVLEHLAIVGSLLEGDAVGAASAMDRHIRSATAILEEVVFPDREALRHPEKEGRPQSRHDNGRSDR